VIASANKRTVAILHHRDLFFGLTADQVPRFIALHDLNIKEPLDYDVRAAIEVQLAWLHHVCVDHGFRPLVSEFSLITETPFARREVEPYFTSFLSFFLPHEEPIDRAYREALTFMASDNAERTQIVPHLELYNDETGLIHVECAGGVTEPSDLEVSLTPLRTTALRQPFELLVAPQRDLKSQVSLFLDRFFENLRADSDLKEALKRLSSSTFLLLPFVRPAYESAALPPELSEKLPRLRGYPGGALFLFLDWTPDGTIESDDRTENDDIRQFRVRHLAQALTLVLSEAGLRESYASSHASESRKRYSVSYQLTHPLKHRLGALQADTRWLTESYEDKSEELEARIYTHRALVESVAWFAELAHTLHYATVHGAQRTLHAKTTQGGLKFAVRGPFNLWQAFTNAVDTIQQMFGQIIHIQLDPQHDLHVMICGFEQVDNQEFVRLKDEIYQEVVYEVIQNLVSHADRETGIVRAATEVISIEKQTALVLTNEVGEQIAQERLGNPEPDWKKWSTGSPTGLTFIAACLRATDAGTLYYSHRRDLTNKRRQFSVGLALKGLCLGP
jgi:hypothetical protein